MTKQEEIIQTIVDYCWWLAVDELTKEELRQDIKEDLMPKLQSQGVVIKVEGKLPENPIKITPYLGLTEEEANTRNLANECFVETIQDSMLKAGYAPVVSLIAKEVQDG